MCSAYPSLATPRRRWLQFSLRGFLILVTTFSVWFGLHLRSARRQQAAVAAIQSTGRIDYDFEVRATTDSQPQSPVPTWLLDTVGVDFFHEVEGAVLSDATPDVVRQLRMLPRLRRLHLGSIHNPDGFNFPGDSDLEVVADLEHLDYLGILGGNVTDRGMWHVCRATSLTELNVLGAKLTDESLRAVAELPQLERLNLTGDFTDDGLANLTGHARLEDLSLVSRTISDAGLKHIARVTSLQVLVLQCPDLTNDGLKHLASLHGLKFLDVRFTRVDDASTLQQALPRCEFAFFSVSDRRSFDRN